MATEIDIAVTTTTYNVSITAEPNEYIVNITTGGSGGVQTVTGTTVDNTDPLNPIVEVPNLTQVLTQDDVSIFIQQILEDAVVTIPLEWQVSQVYIYGEPTIGTGGIFLDKTVVFSDNATLRFCWGVQYEDGVFTKTPEPYEFTTDAIVYYNGSTITSLTIQPNDLVMIKSGGIVSGENVWILTVTNKSSGAGIESVTGTTVNNTDPLNPIVEVPNLTQVLETGNTTVDIGILLTNPPGDFASLNHNQLNVTDGDYTGSLKKNVLQFFNIATGLTTNFLPTGLSLIKSGSESTEVSFETPTALNNILIPNQSGTIAMVSDIPDVTEYLPLAGGTMDAGAEISFDNTSKLAEGSFDSGTGGANGISLFCAAGYEWNFQAGEGYLVRLSDNKIKLKEYARSVPTATDDSSKGFEGGSVWNMVDHNVDYVCADPTVGAAVWQAKEYTFDPATADINYVRNGITGWIEAYSKAQVDALLTAVARTGAVIAFDTDAVYNSIASPSSSNLTDDLTGARLKIVQKIYHNAGTTPTFPAGWVLRGTGAYVTSTLNIIYAEWSVGTTVEYWITQ